MDSIFTKRKQRFSIRKFTVGTASVLLSTMILGSVNPGLVTHAADKVGEVSKGDEVKIKYNYVTEQELTEQEKALIVEKTPEKIAKSDEVYYLVYKPTDKKATLPNTGSGVENIALVGGIGLLVLALGISKNRKKILLSVIALTSMGQLAIGAEASALESKVLAKYNKEVVAKVMDNLENPVIEIDGYKYVGYIKEIKNIKNNNEENSITKPEIIKPKEDIVTQIPDEENVPTVTLPEEKIETTIPDKENFPTEAEKPEYKLTQTEEKEETEIPYTTETRENANLEVGTKKVVQVGVAGKKVVTYKVTKGENGEILAKEEISTETIEAVKEIIEVGTKNLETKIPDEENVPTEAEKPEYKLTQTEEKEETEIPYTTETRENTNLELGTKKVVQAGVAGKKVVTYKVTKGENGEILAKEEISTETIEATKEIIEVGTKKSNVVENIKEETELDFKTIEKENANLPEGEKQVVQEGKKGKKIVEYKVTKNANGDVLSKEIVSEKVEEATDKIIEVGTKKAVNKDELNKAIDSLKKLIVEAKDVDKTNKTELSVTALNNSIKLAQNTLLNASSVVKDSDVNQTDVDSMTNSVLAKIDELTKAKDSLVDKTNKTELKKQLDIAGIKREDDYTPESWAKLQEALKTAQPIYSNDDSTQPEIDSATDKVKQAIENLEMAKVIEPKITSMVVKKDDLTKSFTVDYTLEDSGKTYQSSKLEIYDGNTLVKSVDINFDNGTAKVDVTDLEYNKDYKLVTKLKYNNKTEVTEKTENVVATGDTTSENTVRLELKK